MVEDRKNRVLSIRTGEDIITLIEDFRRAQLAIPSQTEALRALVKLGFDRWKECRGVRKAL